MGGRDRIGNGVKGREGEMKKSKWKIWAVIAVLLAGAYGVYAAFFLKKIQLGELCESSAMCPGECLGFGDLLPDYSHKEICTKQCGSDADCSSTTSCREIEVLKLGKSTTPEKKKYCLPGAK
jgi:hypothetical protein